MKNTLFFQFNKKSKSQFWNACNALMFLVAAWSAQAQETNVPNRDRFIQASLATSNLMACVWILNPIPTPSDVISYGFFSTGTNEIDLYIAPRRPRVYHFCRVEMMDTNGQPLAKTPIAIELNSTFVTQTNKLPSNAFRKLHPEWKQLTPYVASPPKEGSAAYYFYKPEQLFKIEKPGKYILKLEFQAVKPAELRPGADEYVITFPPIKIPIVKPFLKHNNTQ